MVYEDRIGLGNAWQPKNHNESEDVPNEGGYDEIHSRMGWMHSGDEGRTTNERFTHLLTNCENSSNARHSVVAPRMR